jgi:hypothetical protein
MKCLARVRAACLIALLSLAAACSGEREAMPGSRATESHSVAADTGVGLLSVRRIGTIRDLQTPESARWDPELGAWFVSNINGHGLAKDGNGYITRLKPDGTVDSLKFVAGGRNGATLHAPKGMGIVGDTLWVADIDALRGFHRKTGAPIASINVPGAKVLNDVVVGPDGIYITDTGVEFGADGKMTHPGPDRVFRIAGRRVTTAMSFPALPGPNGITWDSVAARFVVVPYLDSTIVIWMQGDSSVTPLAIGPMLMDGVETLGGERYLVTAGADSSLNVVQKGRLTRLAGDLPTPGDVGLDRASGRVAVPLVMENRLELFELGPIAER